MEQVPRNSRFKRRWRRLLSMQPANNRSRRRKRTKTIRGASSRRTRLQAQPQVTRLLKQSVVRPSSRSRLRATWLRMWPALPWLKSLRSTMSSSKRRCASFANEWISGVTRHWRCTPKSWDLTMSRRGSSHWKPNSRRLTSGSDIYGKLTALILFNNYKYKWKSLSCSRACLPWCKHSRLMITWC